METTMETKTYTDAELVVILKRLANKHIGNIPMAFLDAGVYNAIRSARRRLYLLQFHGVVVEFPTPTVMRITTFRVRKSKALKVLKNPVKEAYVASGSKIPYVEWLEQIVMRVPNTQIG